MARAAVGWGVRELAKEAGVAVDTISRLERGEEIMPRTLSAIQGALETAGVVFLDGTYSGSGGPGVRLASPADSPIDTDESETIQYPEFLSGDGGPGSGG
ncbi:helix-turn-helix domain-containing protein [Rhizobium lusitanum]|uniref:helix-turn-helix domain-containing protein n=1 Tax=Rhizobium lusitanum TaxID=293958 RepID=UPI003369E389